MDDNRLVWNEKKCPVAHVKGSSLSSDQGDTLGDIHVIKALKEGESYKFVGVLENAKQEDELVLYGASKVTSPKAFPYLDHSSVGLSQKVIASNQYTLPILVYTMLMQTWPLSKLQQLDRETRKLIKESSGSHLSASTELLLEVVA